MSVLNIILPIFFIIFFGWLLGRFKILPIETAHYLMLFLFWVCAPSIIFSAISSYHISEILAWRFWLAYPLSMLILLLLTYFIFTYLFKESHFRAIAAGFSASMKNTIMIGFPILFGIFGHKAVIPMAISVIIFNCIITPFLTIIFEIKKSKSEIKNDEHAIYKSLLSTVKNPLVLAAFFGVFFSTLEINIPIALKNCFSYLGSAFIPCSLLAIGIELTQFQMSGNIFKILSIVFLNLVIAPIIGLALSLIMHLSDFYASSLIIFSMVPTSKTLYVYLKKYDVFASEAAAIISLTTIFSLVTIPLFMLIIYQYWPAYFLTQ